MLQLSPGMEDTNHRALYSLESRGQETLLKTVHKTRETPHPPHPPPQVFSSVSKKKILWKLKTASDGWLVFMAGELRFSQVTSIKMCEDFVALSWWFFGG